MADTENTSTPTNQCMPISHGIYAGTIHSSILSLIRNTPQSTLKPLLLQDDESDNELDLNILVLGANSQDTLEPRRLEFQG